METYTPEEIKSIRQQLKKAFGIDSIEVEIKLRYLYKEKPIVIHQDHSYYVFFHTDMEEFKKKKGWYEIYITYVRSGVAFFRFKGGKKEFYFVIDSLFAGNLIPFKIYTEELNIPDKNLELISFNRGNLPIKFKVEVQKKNKEIIQI